MSVITNQKITSPESSEYFIIDNEGKINKIQIVKQENDFGVLVDNGVKFQKHVYSKIKLANRNVGLIMRTSTYMSEEMFLTLYKALVRPHVFPGFKKI